MIWSWTGLDHAYPAVKIYAKDFSMLRPPMTFVVKIIMEYGNEGRLVSKRRAAISMNDTPPTKQTNRTGFFPPPPPASPPLDRARLPRLGPGFLFVADDSSSGG